MLSGSGGGDSGKRGSLITNVSSGLVYKRPYAAGVVNISKIITAVQTVRRFYAAQYQKYLNTNDDSNEIANIR